ncbi:TPA: hypothetical protein ACJ509_004005 [Stenotrophomonas maltophilia]
MGRLLVMASRGRMRSNPQGGMHMPEFQYLTPCFERSDTCNLDWAAVAAIGGWAAAAATFIAVVVALVAAYQQTKAAEAAVIAEREKSEHIQEREWTAAKEAHRRTAALLARGFVKELQYARRQLAPRLCNWNPFNSKEIPAGVIESYANSKPFNDLVFIRSCADRLQGFSDGDAFAILNVLTTWQFFNSSPGRGLDAIQRMAKNRWKELTLQRVQFGLQLLEIIDSLIIRMEAYYADTPEVDAMRTTKLSPPNEQRLKTLRENVAAEKKSQEKARLKNVGGEDSEKK